MMASKKSTHLKMRTTHRYLGFFLSGIMAIYALSGIVLIFRDSDAFKKVTVVEKQIEPNTPQVQLGEQLSLKRLEIVKEENGLVYFKNGNYNAATGEAEIIEKELPFILDKITHFHKAKSGQPLFFFNIFFGLSLLFFVISAFWMYMPQTDVFKKGMYFVLGGAVLALVLLFV